MSPPALLYGSVLPAVWSFQLALRARGLGTAPLHVADQAAVNQVVGAVDVGSVLMAPVVERISELTPGSPSRVESRSDRMDP